MPCQVLKEIHIEKILGNLTEESFLLWVSWRRNSDAFLGLSVKEITPTKSRQSFFPSWAFTSVISFKCESLHSLAACRVLEWQWAGDETRCRSGAWCALQVMICLSCVSARGPDPGRVTLPTEHCLQTSNRASQAHLLHAKAASLNIKHPYSDASEVKNITLIQDSSHNIRVKYSCFKRLEGQTFMACVALGWARIKHWACTLRRQTSRTKQDIPSYIKHSYLDRQRVRTALNLKTDQSYGGFAELWLWDFSPYKAYGPHLCRREVKISSH